MLGRIITENVNPAAIEQFVAEAFPSYTTYEANGCWHGTREKSLIIEVDTEDVATLDRVARAIRKANSQQAVLVQTFNIQSHLIQ